MNKYAEKLFAILVRNPFYTIEALHFMVYQLIICPNMTYEEYLGYNHDHLIDENDFYDLKECIKECTRIFYKDYYIEK